MSLGRGPRVRGRGAPGRRAAALMVGLAALLAACGGGAPAKTAGSGSAPSKPAAATSTAKPAASATGFPTRPITLVSWSAAGSPVDVMDREIARYSKQYLGQPMVVEDKTGGDGAVAMAYLLSQPADGYTLVSNTRSLMVSLNTDLKGKFKPGQFDFLATLETDPYVIAVRAGAPEKTLRDLIAATRSKPNFTIGGFGSNSAESLFAQEWAAQAGARISWVPFNGGSAAAAAALGGHIDAVLNHVSDTSAQVKAGKMRVLAESSSAPLPQVDDAPTFAALGYKGLTVSHWRGVMTRAGVPAPVEARLVGFLHKVYNDPSFQAYMKKSGLTPLWNGHAAFDQMVRQDMASIGKQVAGK